MDEAILAQCRIGKLGAARQVGFVAAVCSGTEHLPSVLVVMPADRAEGMVDKYKLRHAIEPRRTEVGWLIGTICRGSARKPGYGVGTIEEMARTVNGSPESGASSVSAKDLASTERKLVVFLLAPFDSICYKPAHGTRAN